MKLGILIKAIIFETDKGSSIVAEFKDYIRLSYAGHNTNSVLNMFDHLDGMDLQHHQHHV